MTSMSHGLLITNSEILKDMYCLNLKAYVDLTCTIKMDLQSTLLLIEQSPNLDVIIVEAQLKDERVALGLHNYMVARDLDEIPTIVIGKDESLKGVNNIHFIENRFDIQNLVRITAKILGITAKDMIKKGVPDYYPVPINIIKNLKNTKTNIYYKTKDKEDANYIKIISIGESPNEKINKYVSEGVKQLYVPAIERLKFTNFISESIIDILNSNDISVADRIDATNLGYEFVAQHIESIESIDDIMEVSRKCVDSITLLSEENPSITSLINKLFSNKTSFAFKHCQLNAFISSYIVSTYDWGTKDHIEKLGHISFFHDILLTKEDMIKIMSNQELQQSPLNDEEKELVKTHAHKTAQLMQTLPRAPIGVDTIIKQHHGMLSGIGFEDKKFSNNLSPLAIIFIVAEFFSSEILKSETIINGKISYDQFDKEEVFSRMLKFFSNSQYKRSIKALENLNI